MLDCVDDDCYDFNDNVDDDDPVSYTHLWALGRDGYFWEFVGIID